MMDLTKEDSMDSVKEMKKGEVMAPGKDIMMVEMMEMMMVE